MSAALKLEIYQRGEFLKEIPCGNQELWIGRDDDCIIRLEDRAISRRHGFLKATVQGIDFEKRSQFGEVRMNGKEIEYASLKNGDRLEMGPYEIRIIEKMMIPPPPSVSVVSEVAADLESKTAVVFPDLDRITPPASEAIENADFGRLEGVEAVNFGGAASEPFAMPGEGLPQAEIPPTPVNPNKTGSFDFAHVENDANTKIFNNQQKEMKAVLQFGDGAANVSEYEITDKEVAIGRSQKCHIVLEDKRSSRKHSIIHRNENKYTVKDLGSANGTLVNGERIDEHELQSGDVIQIGDTQITFRMLQADYEQNKEQFIQVPQEVMPEPVMNPVEFGAPIPEETPDFSAPPPEKKSLIGKYLERYRAMNTKQQIIWGLAILAGVYYMLDDDAPQKRAHLNTGQPKVTQQKKADKKPGSGQSFESLTPEQQRYIETQYQLAFDLYKTRDYDSALLEVGKIFSLVQDFKNAREIEAFAREGKRKLEAQEEERKKKENERQAQIKLQSLIEQAGLLMEKKRFTEAEALFAEIELLQPENAAVGAWRKQMIEEKEKFERQLQDAKKQAELLQIGWLDFVKAKALAKDKKYWDALDAYDELIARQITDKKFLAQVKAETHRVEAVIAADRDPVYAEAKQLEQDGKLSEAYRAYQKAYDIDPTFEDASKGMERIRGTITSRAKAIYAEGVFAESYSDWDTAEKRYHEVMETVPNENDYFVKAQARLKKLTVFRRPAATTGVLEATQ